MLEKFYPDERCRSAYEIDYEDWYRRGKRGLIFDIDNTLVHHGAPATEKAAGLFQRLHEIGFHSSIISNNSRPRVKEFADAVGCNYQYRAGKPNPEGYLAACEEMGTSPAETLFIGDQIFTDVWGARRAGIYSILVEPLYWKEEPQIILKRRLEWFVLRSYEKDRAKRENNG